MSSKQELDKLLPAIMEAVRAEIHTHLGQIIPMLEADLKEIANQLNANLNDLLERVETLEGAPPIPEQSPRQDSSPVVPTNPREGKEI